MPAAVVDAELVVATADAPTSSEPSVATSSTWLGRHGLHGVYPGRHSSAQAETAGCGGASTGDSAETTDADGKDDVPLQWQIQLQLAALLDKVCKDYGVAHGAVALQCKERAGVIDFVATHGVAAEAEAALRRHASQEAYPGDLKLFLHHTRRELPVIIQDTREVAMLRADPLVRGKPHIRFYVSAPLMKGPGEYIGTISIFDSSEKTGFDIKDCEALQSAAAEAVQMILPG